MGSGHMSASDCPTLLNRGGSQLSGFAKLISRECKMPVIIAADPLSCVVVGTMRILDSAELLNKVKIASS